MGRPLQPLVRGLPRPLVNRVKHLLGRGMSGDLDALAMLWNTDKRSDKLGYTEHYARHLGARRRAVRAVLEIGVGGYDDLTTGGESLRMWRNYFPRAHIYGIDIEPKRLDTATRMTVLRADQSDPESLRVALAGCPPFDLIVDDGSHVGRHVTISFRTLFHQLAPGGLYAIEDLVTSYDAAFEGGPPGTPGTAIALVKELVDECNGERSAIASLHLYRWLAIIEKRG